VNVDAAVGQHARFSVDPTYSGVRRNNSFQTLTSDSSRHKLSDLPLAMILADCGGCPALNPSDEDLSPPPWKSKFASWKPRLLGTLDLKTRDRRLNLQ
jgi:hypothetical protein